MTYRQDEIIVASDFNTFRTSVLDVWDVGNTEKGYGQISGTADSSPSPPIPTAVVDDEVGETEWEAFRFAAQTCSDHQGSTTTFPPASELETGEVIEAHEDLDGNAFDINGSLDAINTNSLLFDGGSVSLFVTGATNSRGAPWSNQLQHRFTATLPTIEDARYFFNSGGQIRFESSLTGGSVTPQTDSWKEVIGNMGTIIMNHQFTTGGGLGWSGSAVGYYNLTTSFQQIAIGIDTTGGQYGGYGGDNDITIEARTIDGPSGANGSRGRQLEFRILFTDGHTNAFFDQVDGTITSTINYQKATSPLNISPPVFANSIVLTSGT